MTVLFVCTGNTCRSPMAAALFASICRPARADITVCSAGLCADGSPVSAHSVDALREWDIDIAAHRSVPVTQELTDAADLIAVMSPTHAMALYQQYGVPLIKLRLLGQGIPDPYGGSLDAYRDARDALNNACRALYETLSGAVTVRRMAKQDVPLLAELEALCFADPWQESGFFEELDNPLAVFFVATDKANHLIGYIGMHHVLDEGAITNVAVHPAYRRGGVARALLRALYETPGVDRITLEVRASNRAAIALYEQEGFVRDGVRPRFYTKPTEDAILYSRQKGE